MSTPPPPPPPPGGDVPPPFQPGEPYQPGQLYQPAPTYPPGPPTYQSVPPPYQPGQAPPPGYQLGYGMQPAKQKTNGLSIASLVLGLVNIVPCFWFLPLPAVLAVVFGFVSKAQLKRNEGQPGIGMTIAGIVLGIVFIAVAAAFWVWVANNDNCYRDGNSFRCVDLER